MNISQIIMLLSIIASGIFASFFGGNVPYAFFYLFLTIPMVSFLYTFYVYTRFRLYQKMGSYIVVKGELTPYSFTVANEDFITFSSIRVNFLSDKSTILNADRVENYCLLPNTSKKMETSIRCNYRGEYFIGIESVEIKDFLNLYSITYPIQTKLKVTVLPRIVHLNTMNITPAQKDAKSVLSFLFRDKDTLDMETRPYQVGDSKKQIHWKMSAKMNILQSRKMVTDPKASIVFIMDLSHIQEKEELKYIYEDQIIECSLAMVNYCKDNNTKSTIYFEYNGLKRVDIHSKVDFDLFYQLCVQFHFRSTMTLDHIVSESSKNGGNDNFYIVITHKITHEFILKAILLRERGNDIGILLISDLVDEDDNYIRELKESGILVKVITREDSISEVLSL